jgi:hypothetical protein
MPTGRPKAELVLSEAERLQLGSMARSRSIPAALSLRARIVLATAEGEANSRIAERMQITGATAGKWRRRFIELLGISECAGTNRQGVKGASPSQQRPSKSGCPRVMRGAP